MASAIVRAYGGAANGVTERLDLGAEALPLEPVCVTWTATVTVDPAVGTPLFVVYAFLEGPDGTPVVVADAQSVSGRAQLAHTRDYTVGCVASLAVVFDGGAGAWEGDFSASGGILIAGARR